MEHDQKNYDYEPPANVYVALEIVRLYPYKFNVQYDPKEQELLTAARTLLLHYLQGRGHHSYAAAVAAAEGHKAPGDG